MDGWGRRIDQASRGEENGGKMSCDEVKGVRYLTCP